MKTRFVGLLLLGCLVASGTFAYNGDQEPRRKSVPVATEIQARSTEISKAIESNQPNSKIIICDENIVKIREGLKRIETLGISIRVESELRLLSRMKYNTSKIEGFCAKDQINSADLNKLAPLAKELIKDAGDFASSSVLTKQEARGQHAVTGVTETLLRNTSGVVDKNLPSDSAPDESNGKGSRATSAGP